MRLHDKIDEEGRGDAEIWPGFLCASFSMRAGLRGDRSAGIDALGGLPAHPFAARVSRVNKDRFAMPSGYVRGGFCAKN